MAATFLSLSFITSVAGAHNSDKMMDALRLKESVLPRAVLWKSFFFFFYETWKKNKQPLKRPHSSLIHSLGKLSPNVSKQACANAAPQPENGTTPRQDVHNWPISMCRPLHSQRVPDTHFKEPWFFFFFSGLESGSWCLCEHAQERRKTRHNAKPVLKRSGKLATFSSDLKHRCDLASPKIQGCSLAVRLTVRGGKRKLVFVNIV